MHLFPGKIRIRDTLQQQCPHYPANEKDKETTCCRITHARYESTIDKNLTIKRDTSLSLQHIYCVHVYDKVRGGQGGAERWRLYLSCQAGMMCSVCKKFKTLIQNVKRKHHIPQQKLPIEATNGA